MVLHHAVLMMIARQSKLQVSLEPQNKVNKKSSALVIGFFYDYAFLYFRFSSNGWKITAAFKYRATLSYAVVSHN